MYFLYDPGSECDGRGSEKAGSSEAMLKGLVNLYHGYSEADANSLLDGDHLDPYSGFPAYRSSRCAVRKERL